ncbi:hypothetical protein [Cronobacter sakazakii]|uniref:hypothetical protein n=1 Tax=Cronobacter sakazakii TaxID=28141 RepID=UPI00029C3D25|nr:hypothetical protein [Cronobacter sakazakii]CCK09764.1 Probable transmembrane protein [Cronobacter sakazakii 696]EKK3986621.1 hypothetical protein [Cronobacter sakazakii]ELY2553853.1 hypothetical protein [Cronobacter sakazakii]ELY6004037.1 hypothetical protein [Cronobacter sakazakii]ELY6405024.1 hypothetical protein [Cronobacter sakazakii]
MFTLYMEWEARRKLAPGDIQYIFTPRDALEMASIFYELDHIKYDQRYRLRKDSVPVRRQQVYYRHAAQLHNRRPEYGGLYDEVKWNLEHGWMIGVNTREKWDRFRNPFYFDDESNLVYDCFMNTYGESFPQAVRQIYDYVLNEHQGRKPPPTVRMHYFDAPVEHTQTSKTINSKAAGRLLAAGGIYNGNLEDFHQAARQLGGEAPAGYDQVMDNKGLLITAASVAAGLTMGTMRIQDLEELEYFGAKGTYSGRTFDPELAGGPIENLTTDGVVIDYSGIANVEKHISRFLPDPANDIMIGRLKKIANGEIPSEQVDLNYYTHECREYQRYCNLGWETGQPEGNAGYELWNHAHTATLEDYRLKGKVEDLYHPDALNYDDEN